MARICAVQAEVEGEVVLVRGHADEWEVVFHCDQGSQRLSAVSTCHSQAVGTPGDGISSEFGEVESVIEHHGLNCSDSASATKPNFSTLPPPDHGLQRRTGEVGRRTGVPDLRRKSGGWPP